MKQDKYFWLTTPHQSHIKDMTIVPRKRASEMQNLSDCIWFYDKEEEEAREFFTNLKAWMLENYKKAHPERASWMTKDWVNNGPKYR